MTTKKKDDPYTVKNKTNKEQNENAAKTVVIVKSDTLRLFVSAIKGCISMVILNIEESRMSCSTVDNANVSLIIAECECKTEFEKDAPRRVGVDVNILNKALLHAKGCSVTLTFIEASVEATFGRFTATFPTTDMGYIRKEPKTPTLALNTTVSIPGKYLWDASTSVSKKGRIIIYVKDKVVFLQTEDGDLTQKEVVGTVDKKSNTRSIFSNDYIRKIVSNVRDVDVVVSFDIDHPIKMHAEKNGCKFDFLLAPRIESD